jgi:hypothetical protein
VIDVLYNIPFVVECAGECFCPAVPLGIAHFYLIHRRHRIFSIKSEPEPVVEEILRTFECFILCLSWKYLEGLIKVNYLKGELTPLYHLFGVPEPQVCMVNTHPLQFFDS